MGFIVEGYGDFMHISLLLMEQILELFLMILMGFIIVKAGDFLRLEKNYLKY